MTVTKNVSNVSREIEDLLEQKFTGKVVIGQQERQVKICLSTGELVWVKDRQHFRRRWHRAIGKIFAADDSAENIELLRSIEDYRRLSLTAAKQINPDRVASAIANLAQECLAELSIQQSLDPKLTWTIEPQTSLESLNNLRLSVEQTKAMLLKASLLAQQWQSAELANCLPTFSPVIQQEQMYDAIEMPIPKTYLRGQHSLWDLAVKLKTSVVLITRSLVNLEKQNIVKFQQIPDLPETSNSKTYALQASQPESNNSDIALSSERPEPSRTNTEHKMNTTKHSFDPRKPIVACIDDSPVLAHSVKKILASVGYQSMVISEPMAGMGLLVKYRPNLILLDLLMPTVNGYSVCKFLRETTLFKTTPIIILTSKDTIVDRTRAKLAGATDFLSKPPEPQQLLQLIRLYLIDLPS